MHQAWANQGYTGTLTSWVATVHDLTLDAIYPPWRQLARYAPGFLSEDETGFRVIPRRWVVERTFSWLGRYRCLSKNYGRLTATAEAYI